MNTKNTLKAIIARQPHRDRQNAAFAPYPFDRAEVRHTLRPKTLSALRSSLGAIGGVAATDVVWRAVAKWAAKQPDYILSEPRKVVRESVALRRQELLAQSGLPNRTTIPRRNLMSQLSPECQVEARRVAEHARRVWERAGQPELFPADIVRAHRYFAGCQRVQAEEIAA